MSALSPDDRSSGIILHPTSLPGPYGIGDLGPAAFRWLDLLAASQTALWQLLPLGPTGYADSPYASLSSIAGNINLISPDALVAEGLLPSVDAPPRSNPNRVDFGAVIAWKQHLISSAHRAFDSAADPAMHREYDAFIERHRAWLEDFALFMAIKNRESGRAWTTWPAELRRRDPSALRGARRELAAAMDTVRFGQFLFFRQWARLRAHAAAAGVRIIGDLPFFVAGDSADVWARPDLFELDASGRPTLVAGVPPDYFTVDGQLWGNPQYRWPAHEAERFAWWIRRLGATLTQVDITRIDHFRAFADYWEIPAGAATARQGAWRTGPGARFFTEAHQVLGDMAIIAEDLGEPSPAVPALLEAVGFPGMRVLQLAWDDGDDHPFLPHSYPVNTVAYTGTHDNDTTLGWWRSAAERVRRHAERYLTIDPEDPVGAFLDALWASRAMFTIAPLQDLLRLGSEARINTPGTTSGNWRWRVREDQLDDALVAQLLDLNRRHARASTPP